MSQYKKDADAELSKHLNLFLKAFTGHYFETVIEGRRSASFADDLMKYFYISDEGRRLRGALEQFGIRPEVPVAEPIL